MLVKWDVSLSVGNEQIDRDHMELIEIINNFYQAAENNSSGSIIEDMLSKLSDYVSRHFEYEENIMRQHHYPGAKEHIQQLAELIIGLVSLVYKFESRSNTVPAETLAFLRHWLVDHVKGSDMRLGRFLSSEMRET